MKRLAWFIFKSPQRKLVGYKTWWVDILGCFERLINQIKSPFAPLKEVTICTGLYNRSENYLSVLLPSLLKIKHPEKVVLSVFDCGSNDTNDLESEIKKIWKGKLVFNAEQIPFSRSVAFNRAIMQSYSKLIFVCDADVSVPANLVKKCNINTSKHLAWFPVCFWLNEGKNECQPENGKFFSEGTGLFACQKSQLGVTGMYDENITDWGKEDWDLFFRFYTNKIMPLRTREKTLLHFWHPSQKPVGFKSLF